MNRPGWLLALAGLGFAAFLFAREDTGAIAALLATAGAGLVLAAVTHVFSMVLNAKAWQLLMPLQARPGVSLMTLAVWLRESVNGLLPVARVGGEIVSYRMLVRARLAPPVAAASLIVDMAVSVLSQMLFALVGVWLLVRSGTNAALAIQIAIGLLILVPLVAVFIIVQRGGIFGALARIANRMFAGRLGALVDHSQDADRAVKEMYSRRAAIVGCFVWQCAGWLAGAIEIWAAAYFLGLSVSAVDAIAIEALIQAVSSAAFVVPAALGVQEGAFIVAGAAVGLDATASLSLAAARRVRDLAIFFPGLLTWSINERSPATR